MIVMQKIPNTLIMIMIYVYLHVYIHTCIHTSTNMHTNIHIYIHVYTRSSNTCIHTCNVDVSILSNVLSVFLQSINSNGNCLRDNIMFARTIICDYKNDRRRRGERHCTETQQIGTPCAVIDRHTRCECPCSSTVSHHLPQESL